MKITLRQLAVFAAIAKAGTTIAAAREIHLSQSATSGALTELETLLGARVFDRIGKRLQINDEGRALLPLARATLDTASQIERQFGVILPLGGIPQIAHRLTVGASTTIGNYILPRVAAGYLKVAPSVRLDIVIGNSRDITTLVRELDVDVGFIEGSCEDSDLDVTPWSRDELFIVCAPIHPAAKLRKPSDQVLRESCWLLREPGSGTREVVTHAILPHFQHLEHEMQLGSTEAIKQAAIEGLGIACLSRWAIQESLKLGQLAVVKTSLPALTRPFYLIKHHHKHLSPRLQSFLDYSTGDHSPNFNGKSMPVN